MTVTCETIYANGLLIVKYRFGDAEFHHASGIEQVLRLRSINLYLDQLYGYMREFVDAIVETYSALPHPDFAVALWEVGIGIGGEW
jgi:hypothetical protein